MPLGLSRLGGGPPLAGCVHAGNKQQERGPPAALQGGTPKAHSGSGLAAPSVRGAAGRFDRMVERVAEIVEAVCYTMNCSFFLNSNCSSHRFTHTCSATEATERYHT